MPISRAAHLALMHRLRYLHYGLYFSWRAILEIYYPDADVSHTELSHIAGGKVPKNKRVLAALGLTQERRTRKRKEQTETEAAAEAMSMMVVQGLRNWKRKKKGSRTT